MCNIARCSWAAWLRPRLPSQQNVSRRLQVKGPGFWVSIVAVPKENSLAEGDRERRCLGQKGREVKRSFGSDAVSRRFGL